MPRRHKNTVISSDEDDARSMVSVAPSTSSRTSQSSCRVTPAPKRRDIQRGRPTVEPIEGEEGKGCDKLSALFKITFRPTRSQDCSRETIYNLLLSEAKQLIVSKSENFSVGNERCEYEYVVFFRVKDDTREMDEYNRRKRQRDPKRTFKKRYAELEEIFEPLNRWSPQVPLSEVCFFGCFC